jgi:hypothetical protein
MHHFLDQWGRWESSLTCDNTHLIPAFVLPFGPHAA